MTTATLPRTTPYNAVATLQDALRRGLAFFGENRLFAAGLVLLLALYLFGLIGSQFINPKGSDMGAVPLNLSPSAKYPLGTDGLGLSLIHI